MPHEFVVPGVTVVADARTTRMRKTQGEFMQVRGTRLGFCVNPENFWEYYYYEPTQDESTSHYWRQYCRRAIQFTYIDSETEIPSITAYSWAVDEDLNIVLTPLEDFWFTPTVEIVVDLFTQVSLVGPENSTVYILMTMYREVIHSNYVPPTEEDPGYWVLTRDPNNPPVNPNEESSIPFVHRICFNKSFEGDPAP